MSTEKPTFSRADYKIGNEIENLPLHIQSLRRTADPEELKALLIEKNPDSALLSGKTDLFDSNAELLFGTACAYLDSYMPQEEHFEMDHAEGRQEYIEETEAYQISSETFEELIGALQDTVDLDYFEKFPEGDRFKKLRKHRIMVLKSALRDL